MRRPFSNSPRWPLVLAVHPSDGLGGRRTRLTFAASGLCFVLAAGLAPVPWAARVALFVLGAGLVVLASFARRRTVRASGTFLEADDVGLTRVTAEGKKTILRWDAPYGVTMFASYGRPHALLAFTTESDTRYVPVRVEGRSDADDDLFSRVAVLADLDLVDGAAHEPALEAQDGANVLRHIAERDERALGRLFLSDGRGAPIVLDRGSLSVAGRVFDLHGGLEWRATMFHESTGQAAALYQATWIRQGTTEVVLVAPMPASIVPRETDTEHATSRLGRALTRDIKLLQSPAEPPPSRDLRVAIDRPFMMAVRRALDEAPLAVRLTPDAPPRPRSQRSSLA